MNHAGTLETLGPAPGGGDVLRATIGRDGLLVRVLSFGGILQDVWLDGHPNSLVLGYDAVEDYFTNPSYIGAIVGRYGNRIQGGRLVIGEDTYQLDLNEGGHTHLHGGRHGVSHQNWTLSSHDETTAVFSLRLADQDMGYPGNVDVTLTYEVLAGQTLNLRVQARTDQATAINLVPHFYFKLDQTPTISEHMLQVFSDLYLSVDGRLIPDGAPRATRGTEFDFTQMTALSGPDGGRDIDHNFCFDTGQPSLRDIASLMSTKSNRSVRVSSTKPGLQVYTGRGLGGGGDELNAGLCPFAGVAMEPQFWPNSPNMPAYPSAIFDVEHVYDHRHQYVFA